MAIFRRVTQFAARLTGCRRRFSGLIMIQFFSVFVFFSTEQVCVYVVVGDVREISKKNSSANFTCQCACWISLKLQSVTCWLLLLLRWGEDCHARRNDAFESLIDCGGMLFSSAHLPIDVITYEDIFSELYFKVIFTLREIDFNFKHRKFREMLWEEKNKHVNNNNPKLFEKLTNPQVPKSSSSSDLLDLITYLSDSSLNGRPHQLVSGQH